MWILLKAWYGADFELEMIPKNCTGITPEGAPTYFTSAVEGNKLLWGTGSFISNFANH